MGHLYQVFLDQSFLDLFLFDDDDHHFQGNCCINDNDSVIV